MANKPVIEADWLALLHGDREPSRRITVPVPGGVASFSVPTSVSDAEALNEFLRCEERIEWGHSRKIVNIDGWRGLAEGLRVLRSYVEMWSRIAWRATFGRRATLARIEQRRAFTAKARGETA